MQLICDGLDLSDAVLKVSKAIATKTTNPVLEGVRLVAEENEIEPWIEKAEKAFGL